MNTTTTNQTVKVGHVSVDSGQVIIADPCYIMDGPYDDAPVHDPKDHKTAGYGHPCKVTLSDKGYGEFPVKGFATAIASGSGYGDGHYPVYGDMDEDGRVVALHIYFDEDPHSGEQSMSARFITGLNDGTVVYDEDKGHYVDLNEVTA
jgi:hypothetical protein